MVGLLLLNNIVFGMFGVGRLEILKEVLYKCKLPKNNDTYTYKRVISNRYWDDKMYLFPIPDSEIRKNPNLIQNRVGNSKYC